MFSDQYRYISIIAITQFLVVVIGIMGIALVMKFHGYPETQLGIRWNGNAIFLRSHPGVLFLVPCVWTALAVWLELKGEYSARVISISFAAILVFAMIVFMIDVMANPFTRGIIKYIP